MAVKRKAATKKAATKKTTTKKAAAKRAPAKKAATKKVAAKKTATKKVAAKKAPARKTAKKATPEVLTLRHIAADLAEAYELPKKTSEEILGDFIETIRVNLKKGKKVRIAGFGVMEVKKRAARMGRNPATGETIRIKASKKVAFRAAKDLKEAVL